MISYGEKRAIIILVVSLCLLGTFLPACGEKKAPVPKKKVGEQSLLKAERSQEDYAEAIENFQQLLEKEPGNIILLISLGNAYFDVGRDRDAIEVYLKALEIYPDNVAVRTDLGTAYRRIKEPDKAIEEYNKSIAIDPRHSISRYNLGVVYLWDRKNIKKAITIWKELLRIDPYFVLSEELKNNIKILNDIIAESEAKKP